MQVSDQSGSAFRSRIEALDLARGIALGAMAIYHFAWDLEFFGYAEPGMTTMGGWKFFARCIASSFLFLAGVSLVLAHRNGIRWQGFWRRFAAVAGAALAISLVTYVAVPGGFIFFGILHQIAFASLAGLLFLRLPAIVTLVAAAAVIAAPQFLRADVFNHWTLWWIGLSTQVPRSNDFVPVFPWFGAVLAGIAVGRFGVSAGWWRRLGEAEPGNWSSPLQFAGRHSLAVYLIHQPVLISLLFLASLIAPPDVETREVSFLRACEAQCRQVRDEEFCMRYCGCVLERAEREDRMDQLFEGGGAPDTAAWTQAAAEACTREADPMSMEEAR